MGDVLSILVVAVLAALIVVSMRRQRLATATSDADLKDRVGADGAQRERSMAERAKVRAAQQD
jgi:hypothetical protein